MLTFPLEYATFFSKFFSVVFPHQIVWAPRFLVEYHGVVLRSSFFLQNLVFLFLGLISHAEACIKLAHDDHFLIYEHLHFRDYSYTYVDELHPSLVAKVDYVKTIFPRWCQLFVIAALGYWLLSLNDVILSLNTHHHSWCMPYLLHF